MTTPLITDHQLAFMRQTAERAFTSDVDVYRRTLEDSIYEDDAIEVFTLTASVKGWVYSTPTSSASEIGGVIGTLNLYRLFVPVGTDVQPGDKLVINGQEFMVIDTIDESTWLPLLRCSLRRVE